VVGFVENEYVSGVGSNLRVVAPRADMRYVEESLVVDAGDGTPVVVPREHRIAERGGERAGSHRRLVGVGLVLVVLGVVVGISGLVREVLQPVRSGAVEKGEFVTVAQLL
jgi:hypothetical protein